MKSQILGLAITNKKTWRIIPWILTMFGRELLNHLAFEKPVLHLKVGTIFPVA